MQQQNALYAETLDRYSRLISYYASRYCTPPLAYDDLYQEGAIILYDLVRANAVENGRLVRRLINRYTTLYRNARVARREIDLGCVCLLHNDDWIIDSGRVCVPCAEEHYLHLERIYVARFVLDRLYQYATGDAFTLLAALDANLEDVIECRSWMQEVSSILGWHRFRVYRSMLELRKIAISLRALEEKEDTMLPEKPRRLTKYSESADSKCPQCDSDDTQHLFNFRGTTKRTLIESWTFEEKRDRCVDLFLKCAHCGYTIVIK